MVHVEQHTLPMQVDATFDRWRPFFVLKMFHFSLSQKLKVAVCEKGKTRIDKVGLHLKWKLYHLLFFIIQINLNVC